MPWLVEVYLDSQRLTDACISHLLALPSLQRLHLVRTAISDDATSQLSQMKQLTKLNLKGSRVSDEGIARLADLPLLQSLEITDCPITDAAASDLARLQMLNELLASGTKLTGTGIAAHCKHDPNASHCQRTVIALCSGIAVDFNSALSSLSVW